MVQSMQVKVKWGSMKCRLSGLTYDDVNPTDAITSESAALAKHVSEWQQPCFWLGCAGLAVVVTSQVRKLRNGAAVECTQLLIKLSHIAPHWSTCLAQRGVIHIPTSNIMII